ncbi:ferredoxin [Desulfosarcina ovata subsp. sediminis]|uniref:Ferredoxin n=1 Tax=Desulfosarcina ovata subsp. sediminis TaxID=885957 RepID=A0A5K7ZQ02_9BACT|nr:(2Fe-2S)-binding protein [Desulfosarcina ovata]BBO82069.1 ferredoxin [Desulfosarcina ovata subsp. sediminis]
MEKNRGEVEKEKDSKKAMVTSENAEKRTISFVVNGKPFELRVGKDVNTGHTLAHTLRETLGYTGTKIACDHGGCGSCTVLIDGEPISSCMTLTVECDGKSITTIEGLRDEKTGELDPLQQEFIDKTAFQCGFCTPGFLMSAKALLTKNPAPKEQDVKEALSGHYCRCISHYQVVDAVMAAAEKGR